MPPHSRLRPAVWERSNDLGKSLSIAPDAVQNGVAWEAVLPEAAEFPLHESLALPCRGPVASAPDSMMFRQTALAFAALAFAGRAFSQAPADPPELPAPGTPPTQVAPSDPIPGLTPPGDLLPPTIPPPSTDPLGGRFGDAPIDISADRMGASGELATASGNVQISFGATTIYCDEALYDPNTRDVIVTGNVRIYREGQLVIAERAVYNLETKDITAATSRGSAQPFKYSSTTFQNIPGSTGYLVKEGIFTTSDSANPDWSVRARRARIYPKDRIVFQDVKIYIGNTPVFWFPYFYQSLNKQNAFTITPGYNSTWGSYVLTNYTFPITETMGGMLRLDYRSSRGPAIGLETQWETGEKKQNWGRFRSYAMDDSNPGINRTALAREDIDSGRYRVSFQARQYLTEDIYASVDITKLSDARFLQDFYEGEFRENPQPDNMLAFTKLGDDYELTLLARKQLNEFFDVTERVPELALDITQQPLFGSKVFYQGETSVGRYTRNFAKDSLFEDYSSGRFDTFHQFSLPMTVHNWLSIIPRVGVRGTWYSESGPIVPVLETETIRLPDGTTRELQRTFQRLAKNGDVFRPVVNAGLEMSFKSSKAYEDVQSRIWGLDGLRHVVQPYLDLSIVQAGSDNKDILRFDRLSRSTQPPPIDFPAFNSIDSIDDWNILRLGVKNRLQTRRDNATFNWFEMNTYFDIHFDRPDFGLEPDPGTFSNLVNRIRWTPLSWVNFTLDCQLPIFDSGFTEVNTRANFFVNDRVQFNIGHRYLSDNILFRDSSQLDFAAYYRFDDNWAFSMRETYEFNDSLLQNQRYELHRDLSSWIASLGFVVRANSNSATGKEVNDYGVILTFTLKDLPDVKLPISFDPSGTGSSGSRNP
jgi:lipopolysaccharide assembly outer membrane protein LptD (OstA)